KEGDFTMILGYPGRTYRLREADSIEFQQQTFLPFFIDILQARINLLDELGRENTALQLRFAPEKFSLSNAVKNFQGSLQGLNHSDLIKRKRNEEAKFEQFINEQPTLKAKYGDVLPKMHELYRELNRYYAHNSILNGLISGSETLRSLSYIVARAVDRD